MTIRDTMCFTPDAPIYLYIQMYIQTCAKYISLSWRSNEMCDKTPQGILIPKWLIIICTSGVEKRKSSITFHLPRCKVHGVLSAPPNIVFIIIIAFAILIISTGLCLLLMFALNSPDNGTREWRRKSIFLWLLLGTKWARGCQGEKSKLCRCRLTVA